MGSFKGRVATGRRPWFSELSSSESSRRRLRLVELRVRAPIVSARHLQIPPVQRDQRGDAADLRDARGNVLPAAHRAPAGFALRSDRRGRVMLPITFMLFALSSRSGGLSARIGPRLQMSVGPIVVAAGLALLSRASMPEGTTSSRCCRLCSCSASGSRSSSHRSPPPPCHRRLPNAVDWRRRSTTPWRVPGACSRSHCCRGRRDHRRQLPASCGVRDRLQHAALIASVICAAGGLLAVATIRNPRRPAEPQPRTDPVYHCAADSPPLRADTRG